MQLQRMDCRGHEHGFSLIELMVAVMIAAILIAVALPTYKTQIRKSRRVEAKTALLDLAGREERYFNANNANGSYTSVVTNLGYAAATPLLVGSGYYSVTVSANPPSGVGVTPYVQSTFTISAVPYTTDQLKDASCQYFSVDNTGKQSASDAQSGAGNDTTSSCW